MQPYEEYTICRGHPKASCKACRARIQGRYYRENTAARLQNGQRSRLRAAQLAQGVRPFRNLFWYVGCSPSYLVSYIEAMLPPEWTWENHGKLWNVDHKVPLCSADLSCPFELYRLAHYTNLQPLSLRENIAKGPRRSVLSFRERRDDLIHPPARTERYSDVDQSGIGDSLVSAEQLGSALLEDRVRGGRPTRGERPVGPRSSR